MHIAKLYANQLIFLYPSPGILSSHPSHLQQKIPSNLLRYADHLAEDKRLELQKNTKFENKTKDINLGGGCRLHSIANAASCQGYLLI